MTDRVVVGIDGSLAGQQAASFALREARRRDCTLEVMHAFEVPITAVDPMGAAYVAVDHDALVASAREMLDGETARLAGIDAKIAIDPILHEGSTTAMLADASKDAALLVVGTRHASELTGFVRGSVCRHVLHRAHCPVVVVPVREPATDAAHVAGQPEEELTMKKIVVGIDGSDHARRALQWAWDEAHLWGGELHVVHAWVYPYAYGHRITVTEPVEQVKLDAAHLMQTEIADLVKVKGEGVTIHAHLDEGSPTEVLLTEGKDADLVVVGSRGRGGLRSLLLGSVAHQVSNHAVSPVVVVRAPEA
jgi:nucleotide-binding universal stress UspA family protein